MPKRRRAGAQHPARSPGAGAPVLTELGRMLAQTNKRFYCVSFSMRSGSTLLSEDLRNWDLGAPGEFFQSPLYPVCRDESAVGYVLRLVRESPGDTFGFKATWGQIGVLMSRLRDDGVDAGGDLRTVFPGLRYVHLVRSDKVAQAVSAWRAITSGVWHVRVGETLDPGRPAYDFLAIRTQLLQILAEEWLWRASFDRLGIAALTVGYEDFVAHREATLHRLAGWLGAGDPAPVSSDFRILRDEWSDDTVSRVWEDLCRASDVEALPVIESLAIGSSLP